MLIVFDFNFFCVSLFSSYEPVYGTDGQTDGHDGRIIRLLLFCDRICHGCCLLCGQQVVVSRTAVTRLRPRRTVRSRLRTSPACIRETSPACTSSWRCRLSWSMSDSSTLTWTELLRSRHFNISCSQYLVVLEIRECSCLTSEFGKNVNNSSTV